MSIPIRSVLEIQDNDPLCAVSVPDTRFTIIPPGLTGNAPYILRDDSFDEELTERMLQRFKGDLVDAATARRIAGWLREGAP
jgi:hypothetical protein